MVPVHSKRTVVSFFCPTSCMFYVMSPQHRAAHFELLLSYVQMRWNVILNSGFFSQDVVMFLFKSFNMSDCTGLCAYTNVHILWNPDTLYLWKFLLWRNLYGKRPADYAVSLEMLEIFQKASEGNQDVKTSLSPSAGLSVVREPEDANHLLHSMSLAFVKLRSLISDVLMLFLRWATVWGRMTWSFSCPASYHNQSSINWPNLENYWEGGWLTPFLAQVVLFSFSSSSVFPTTRLGVLVPDDSDSAD